MQCTPLRLGEVGDRFIYWGLLHVWNRLRTRLNVGLLSLSASGSQAEIRKEGDST